MGSRLVVDIKYKDQVVYCKLTGYIDEDNDLAEITKQISKQTVVLNTANVERINSCGVRDWVSWLGELDKQGIQFYLIECSPAIMTQVNLVNNFIGSGKVLSFFAPYFCSGCDSEKMLLIEVEEALKSMPFSPPTCRCDQCDHTMDFDDIESSYFAFLNSVQWLPINNTLSETIRFFSSDTPGQLRTRSATIPPILTSGGSVSPISTVSSPFKYTPTSTTPSSKDLLKNLVSENITFTSPGETGANDSSRTNMILYLVVGLLIVAILLLGYVVFRTI